MNKLLEARRKAFELCVKVIGDRLVDSTKGSAWVVRFEDAPTLKGICTMIKCGGSEDGIAHPIRVTAEAGLGEAEAELVEFTKRKPTHTAQYVNVPDNSDVT